MKQPAVQMQQKMQQAVQQKMPQKTQRQMPPQPLKRRLGIASRVLAAALGGYALTSVLATLLALLLPMPRAHATMAATDLGFLFFLPVLIGVFHARSATRAWMVLAVCTAVAGGLSWWLHGVATP